MTFKIKILNFMTKVKPNNGNTSKSDIFHGTYPNLTSFFIDHKILKYFNDTLIIDIFQFHCRSKYKQVKCNKFKRDMSKSDIIVPYLERSALFK